MDKHKKIKSLIINNISDEAKIIFKIFGDQVRLVGGAVRNLLIAKPVEDFDFATTLDCDTLIKKLKKYHIKTITLAKKYGTVIAVINNKNIEITHLRSDRDFQGRACEVDLVNDYYLDAQRRDFTINALYLDSQGFVYDYFNSLDDLKNQRVRFIGDPWQRINEDFLRILRFFRFSSQFASDIDKDGLKACLDNAVNLNKLSSERIKKEMFLIFNSLCNKQLLKILEIFNHSKILNEIWGSSFDGKALEQYNSLQKQGNLSDNFNLKLAIIHLNYSSQNEIYGFEFIEKIDGSKQQKKYFYDFKISHDAFKKEFNELFLDLEINSHKNIFNITIINKIKELITVYNYQNLFDILIFFIVKKNLDPKNLMVLKFFFDSFKLPKFILDGYDIKDLNLSGKQISQALKLAKKYWLEKNFEITKSQLINYLKKIKFQKN